MSWKTATAKIVNALLRPWDVSLVRATDVWRPTAQLTQQPAPPRIVIPPAGMEPFLKNYVGEAVGALQVPFDFAVVMPTMLRPSIADAIASVFSQDLQGRVQLLIGVDAPGSDLSPIEKVCATIPRYHAVQILYPGYSTSRRHGGLHPAWDGGVLRTTLSYLANSRYVAYLDDDNWFAPHHLSSLYDTIQGQDWAYALRWFVHPRTRKPICEDRWESIGPTPQGTPVDPKGWVDPNCLAIDKLACEAVLRWWGIPLRNTVRAMDADRNVFDILSTEFRGRATNEASVFYALDESDPFRHPFRLEMIGADRYASAGAADPARRSQHARESERQ
jgi:hypothetical protein